ncbi:MAG: phosphoribosylformylglycinamidine synthase subunit PurS [Elusimicrobia bacterium]|nr:phosphoribosylformylglycinamidine synthase subunit PurS [Elusimicrobiota bacterium]
MSVVYRRGVRDPLAASIRQELPELGMRVRRVHTAQLYRLVGRLMDSEVKRIVRDLLVDPVIQEARWGRTGVSSPSLNGRVRGAVSLEVWLKPRVTDVVGESVLKGISDLGILTVETVRAGTGYLFEGLKGKAQVQQIAERLLVNPLIHDYHLGA